MVTEIQVPMLNVNDVEVRLARWEVSHGEQVELGQVLCQLESTKAASELEAPVAGVIALLAAEGDLATVGQGIALIAASRETLDKALAARAPQRDSSGSLVSRAAAVRMRELGMDSAEFAHLPVVRVSDVEAVHAARQGDATLAYGPFDSGAVAIYGTGSQAVLAFDALIAAGAQVALFIDFEVRAMDMLGLPVTPASQIGALTGAGLSQVHIALPDEEHERRAVKACADAGLNLVSAVHPAAAVSPSALLGANLFVGAGAMVGPLTTLEDFARVLPCASVAHHSRIGEGARISDGARIAGHCSIGARSLIGLNACVSRRLSVGRDCIVVSGAVVGADMPDRHVVRLDGKCYPRPT